MQILTKGLGGWLCYSDFTNEKETERGPWICSLSQLHLSVQLLSALANLATSHLPRAILEMFGLLMIMSYTSLMP